MSSGTEKQWLLPAFIVLGVLCLFFISSKLGSPPNVQAQPQTGPVGRISVIPVQISRDSYGFAMVDTVSQTLWIYELNSRGPVHNRLRLLAARSWRYDRLLQQYNTAEPKPEQVKILLENLRQQPEIQENEEQQDSDINIQETTEPNNNDSKGR